MYYILPLGGGRGGGGTQQSVISYGEAPPRGVLNKKFYAGRLHPELHPFIYHF